MIIFARGWSLDFDGPGQRYVYYSKGCNMRCTWCANPESQHAYPEILFYPDREKTNIEHVCSFHAIKDGQLDREKCAVCSTHECVTKWKHPCFEYAGENISPQQILRHAGEAKKMFGKNGGITFGGGEPLLQFDELFATLNLLKKHKIHTAVETNASTAAFKKLVALTELLICDFKAFDTHKHKNMAAIANDLILENLEYAIREKEKLWIRIPLVPGLNDTAEEMEKMSRFLLAAAAKRKQALQVDILRMHHLGEPKYKALGMDYPVKDIAEPACELSRNFLKILKHDGIKVQIGG